jgi:hypothetical protein
VSNISVNFILSSAKDLVLPLNFEIENAIEMGCGPNCFLTKGVPLEIKEAVNKRMDILILDEDQEKVEKDEDAEEVEGDEPEDLDD